MATSKKVDITNREYVSDATEFLRALETHSDNNRSVARQAEEVKYTRINKLRDEAQAPANNARLWQGF